MESPGAVWGPPGLLRARLQAGRKMMRLAGSARGGYAGRVMHDADDESESLEQFEAVAAPEDAGARLDRFLAARVPGLSRTRLRALIEQGHVLHAGAPVRDASAGVKPGVYMIARPAPDVTEAQPEPIDLVILHEDGDVLVIDKPSGLAVHPAPGNWSGTLVNAVLHHCGLELARVGAPGRPGIVHRLDKDTSGVMVVAKTDRALRTLAEQFAKKSVGRRYDAFTVGAPAVKEGRIITRIGRDPRNRKRMAVLAPGSAAGKEAVTAFEVVARFGPGLRGRPPPAAAHVACRLETGRTHQIRVHLAHIGASLIGDGMYGATRSARVLDEALGGCMITRQALHAATLSFDHPATGHRLSFETPWPDDIERLHAALQAL